ncbi:MAG: hypothetical protein FJ267_04720 [Planctomycetes bacterium]|nr:hypothetical protein [Planctomycetota bacterium]
MSLPIDPRRIELIDPIVAQILRTKTPAEKLAIVFDAHQMAFDIKVAQIRQRNPDWSESRVRSTVVRRLSSGPQ